MFALKQTMVTKVVKTNQKLCLGHHTRWVFEIDAQSCTPGALWDVQVRKTKIWMQEKYENIQKSPASGLQRLWVSSLCPPKALDDVQLFDLDHTKFRRNRPCIVETLQKRCPKQLHGEAVSAVGNRESTQTQRHGWQGCCGDKRADLKGWFPREGGWFRFKSTFHEWEKLMVIHMVLSVAHARNPHLSQPFTASFCFSGQKSGLSGKPVRTQGHEGYHQWNKCHS